MSTQLILIADERGFTVQHSTTHQTQDGALAHFTEVLARLHHEHPSTKSAEVVTRASTAEPASATAIAEASGPAQLSTVPFTRPRPTDRSQAEGCEGPSF